MLHLEIKEALKNALKARDTMSVSSIRIILGELSRLKGSRQGTKELLGDIIPDAIVVKILNSLKKEELEKLNYTKDSNSNMINTLDQFLPKTVSKEVIREWIFGNDILNGLRHPNQSISLAKKEFGMNVDANDVKEVVEDILAKLNEGL